MHAPRVFSVSLYISVLGCIVPSSEMRGSKDEEVDLGEVVQYRDGDILLAVFVPVTDHQEATGKCNRTFTYIHMVEQVNMMIEKVNADESILPGVKLGTIMINTCLSQKHSLKKLLLDVLRPYILGLNCTKDYCKSGKQILAGVVGAARSSVSIDLAKVLQVFSIPQVSYWSTNQELSDKLMYKYFFRTVPSDTHQTLAMAELIRNMSWNYVSIVYDNDAYGIRAYAELLSTLKASNICVAAALPYEEVATEKETAAMVALLVANKRSKAVILYSHRSVVGKLLTSATRVRGGTDLTWIASDAWANISPLDPDDRSYISVIHGTLGVSPKYPSTDQVNKRIRSLTIQDYRDENATLNPWWVEYVQDVKKCTINEGEIGKRLCDEDENIRDFTGVKNGMDDAVNAFIHAIDAYHRNVCNDEPGVCEELAITAGTNEAAKKVFQYLKNVSFGLSDGRTFSFNGDQDGPPVYDLSAFDINYVTEHSVLDGWRQVGTFINDGVCWNSSLPEKTNSTKSTCSDPCKKGEATIAGDQVCCWFCQKCSQREYVGDGACMNCSDTEKPNEEQTGCVPIEIAEMGYSSGYALGSISVGLTGLIFTILITAMYWKNKDTAIVRASGRELCFFVLFGVFLTLLNCFAIAGKPSPVSCGASRTILAMGPSIMYAGLLMKTFRVVFIFQSKGILSLRTKGYLEPIPLIFLTLCVVLIQVVVVIVWLLTNRPEEFVRYFYESNTAFRSCKHLLDLQIFVGLAYPFLIIIVCTILATINRNVPTGFRETLFVGFTMYTTCVTWIAFLPLFFTIPTDIPRQLTTLSI